MRQINIDLRKLSPGKNDSTMEYYNWYANGKGGYCDVWTPNESYWCSNITSGTLRQIRSGLSTDPVLPPLSNIPKVSRLCDGRRVTMAPPPTVDNPLSPPLEPFFPQCPTSPDDRNP
jgi:hypothetical protein